MMRHSYNSACLLFAAMLVAMPTQMRAQSDEDPVEAGRSSLQKSNNFPWYDADNDDVRRIDVFPPKKVEEESLQKNVSPRLTKQKSSSPTGFEKFFADLITIMFWVFIAILLGFLVGLVIWVFLRMESNKANQSESTLVTESGREVDRVENLPFNIKNPTNDLLSAARQSYESDNLRDAIIYLFSYQLVHLDKNQLIHLAKGKTNRQYLFELRRNSVLLNLLESTMVAFEDVFFGDRNLRQREFERCWGRLDEFHDLVGQGAAS